MASEARIALIRKLVMLASSDNANESEVAARKACALLREEGATEETIASVLALPASSRAQRAPAPAQPSPTAYEYHVPSSPHALGWGNGDIEQQMATLQREVHMRAAQVAARDRELSAAERYIDQLERENDALARSQPRRLAPKGASVIRPPLTIGPVGAGKREVF